MPPSPRRRPTDDALNLPRIYASLRRATATVPAEGAMIRTCRRGHEQTPANQWSRGNGRKECRLCGMLRQRQSRLRTGRTKYESVEPEAEYVSAADCPGRDTKFANGYWRSIVRRVSLMEPGEGVRVPLHGLTLTNGPYLSVMRISHELKVRVRVAIRDGWLWVVKS